MIRFLVVLLVLVSDINSGVIFAGSLSQGRKWDFSAPHGEVMIRTTEPFLLEHSDSACKLFSANSTNIYNQPTPTIKTQLLQVSINKFLEIASKKIDLSNFFKSCKHATKDNLYFFVDNNFYNEAVGFYINNDGDFKGFYISSWFFNYLDLSNQQHINMLIFGLLHQFSYIYFCDKRGQIDQKKSIISYSKRYAQTGVYVALELSGNDKQAAQDYFRNQDHRYLYYFDELEYVNGILHNEDYFTTEFSAKIASYRLKTRLNWISEFEPQKSILKLDLFVNKELKSLLENLSKEINV